MSEEYRALTVTKKSLKSLKTVLNLKVEDIVLQGVVLNLKSNHFYWKLKMVHSPSDRMVRMDSLKPCTHNTVQLKRPYKFAEPSKLLEKGDVNVLDICSGLGYN
jgi:hypothetical protein